jgi:hypothetical protein
MQCNHDQMTEVRIRIRPPQTTGFIMRYSVCPTCGAESCSAAQRKKNRKQYRYAQNRYRRMQPPQYITEPSHGLW